MLGFLRKRENLGHLGLDPLIPPFGGTALHGGAPGLFIYLFVRWTDHAPVTLRRTDIPYSS